MHHDEAGDQTPRSRWPHADDAEDTGQQVFDQEEYSAPVWDSWSDNPETFPLANAGFAFTREAPAADPYGRPGAPAATDSATTDDEESTESWHFPDTMGVEVDAGGDTDRDEDTSPIIEELTTGLVVADRYRLEERLVSRNHAHSWRAFDQKLSRPVMLHLLEADRQRNDQVLDAARRSAIATDSRFLRVLDAINGGDVAVPGLGACIVSEYVPGHSLETLLASGPLSGTEAAWVVRELADALVPMHAKGLFHQQLTPDTVVVTATGNVKIVGFLIEEAMHPSTEHGLVEPDSWSVLQESDVRALGQLLYATLVNRWPAPHSQANRRHWGMAAAPMDGHGWLTPRQVRAGVAPALDVVCDQVLSQVPRTGAAPITTAAQLDDALSRVLGTIDASADLEHRVRYPVTPEPTGGVARVAGAGPGPRPSGPSPSATGAHDDPDGNPGSAPTPARPPHAVASASSARDELSHPRPAPRHWLVVLCAVVALTLVGSLIAVAINNRSDPGTSADTSSQTTSAQPVRHPFAKVDDFDPEADGGNNEENPGQLTLAHDNLPETAWTTLRYIGNPALGGLKTGVGVVVDLGQVVDVGRLTLNLQGSPTNVQVLIPTNGADDSGAPAPMRSIEDWTVIAKKDGAGEGETTLTPASVAKTRYVLVYLTSLPNIGGDGYRGAIAEIGVFDR